MRRRLALLLAIASLATVASVAPAAADPTTLPNEPTICFTNPEWPAPEHDSCSDPRVGVGTRTVCQPQMYAKQLVKAKITKTYNSAENPTTVIFVPRSRVTTYGDNGTPYGFTEKDHTHLNNGAGKVVWHSDGWKAVGTHIVNPVGNDPVIVAEAHAWAWIDNWGSNVKQVKLATVATLCLG